MTNLSGVEPQARFLQQLFDYGHLIPSGEAGVYGRGTQFNKILDGVGHLITHAAQGDSAETLRFPPVFPRNTLEQIGYLKSFPQLCGAVFSFSGNDLAAADLVEQSERGADWAKHLNMTDVVMLPAACYPAYPAIARRGPLPRGGATLDLGPSYVFRNEPSGDPARLQMFQQREMVRIGTEKEVLFWREMWMERASGLFSLLGLDAQIDLASDPFFGRGGKLLAKSQREQSLKFEVLVPIASIERTAVASFNFHQQHFGSKFGIELDSGTTASSACLGFGMERITLALLKTHGLEFHRWPSVVRRSFDLIEEKQSREVFTS